MCGYSTACKDAWEEEAKEWWVFTELGGDDWEVVPVESKEDLDFILGSRKEEFEEEFKAFINDGGLQVEQKEGWLERNYAKWNRYEAAQQQNNKEKSNSFKRKREVKIANREGRKAIRKQILIARGKGLTEQDKELNSLLKRQTELRLEFEKLSKKENNKGNR